MNIWKDRKKKKKKKGGRERASELEKIKLVKEVEIQRIRSEHEFKIAQMQARNREQDVGLEPDENGAQGDNHRNGSMKALKLPPFNEEKDDLDAYLTRFERACVAFEVRPEHGQGRIQAGFHSLPEAVTQK